MKTKKEKERYIINTLFSIFSEGRVVTAANVVSYKDPF